MVKLICESDVNQNNNDDDDDDELMMHISIATVSKETKAVFDLTNLDSDSK